MVPTLTLSRFYFQSLFPQSHLAQVHLGHPALLTHWASPGDEDMSGYLDRNHWQVDDLPGAVGPAPGQAGAALEAGVQDVRHPVGGVMRWRAKPWGRGFLVCFSMGGRWPV